jgi:putative membrane protein
MNPTLPFLSYCGPSPVPENIWMRWNLDPVLLTAIAACVMAFVFLRRDAAHAERWCFTGAIATLLIAFVSPLCALTVALFSARVVHHVLLVAIAAPLIALAFRSPSRHLATLTTPILLLHTVVFWLWHAPDAYTLALSNTAVYWVMQVSLLGTAALLWAAVFAAATGPGIVALLGTTIQMGFLGALLVFSPQALYLPHLSTTLAFGLEPLTDQQLAGLIMWVPASLPYLVAALMRLLPLLKAREAHQL